MPWLEDLKFPRGYQMGTHKVLLVCDKDNIGSVKSIINNGGVLENEVLKEGKLIQRYWIML